VRATFPLGLAFGWKRLTAVFVTGVALIAVGSAAGPAGWWTGVAISAAAAVAVLVTWRGAPLLTLAVTRVRPLDLSLPPAADHDRTFGAGLVGIRSVGTHLVAVVAVDGPPHSPSVLVHHQVEAAATLPLGVAAAGLRQCDVTLAGIDIVSAGVRVAPTTHHHHAPVYSSRVGDHPAVGQRRTWLVLRLDVAAAVRAILWRESVAATLAGAAEHLVQRLTSMRIPARVLCASEIEQMDEVLLAGAEFDGLRRRWGRLRHTGGYVQTYWMSPQDISTAAIGRLWAPETDATVTTVQLRPTSDGSTAVGVLVRYHTGGPLREVPLTGLNPLTGRHDVGTAAGLAAPTGGLLAPARRLRDRERLAAPIGASGIIVGATSAGHPLLIDLTPVPAKTTIVTITGELALMVQVALRAAATGYQVIVNTTHHERWRQATAAGLQLAGPGGLGERLPASAQPWLVVYDETSGPMPAGAAVVVRSVDRDGAAGDVRIDQDDDRSAVIHTRALRCRVRIDLDHERRLVVHGEPGKTAA
jgi:type VII secretion protein EccE